MIEHGEYKIFCFEFICIKIGRIIILMQFLGLLIFYRNFILNYTAVVEYNK